MRIVLGVFIFSSLVAGKALAEFRMFTLKITDTKTQAFRLVDSNLDPLQYPGYYPVGPDEIVQYTATWRCKGRTGPEIPVCPNPRLAPAANP